MHTYISKLRFKKKSDIKAPEKVPFFMHVSNKIHELSQNPQYNLLDPKIDGEDLTIQLPHLGSFITLKLRAQMQDELMLREIRYYSPLSGIYLGILDGFIQLIKDKAVEALDRLTPKELDYFLRDANTEKAFEFYTREIYEILSVGEMIYHYFYPKEKTTDFYNKEEQGEYSELSFSEQIEWFEEFMSKFIYPNPAYKDLVLDIIDINKDTIFINSKYEFSNNELRYIVEKFNAEFLTNYHFSL